MKHLRKVKDQIAQRDARNDMVRKYAEIRDTENEILKFQRKELEKKVEALEIRVKDRDALLAENILLENQLEDLKKEVRDLEIQLEK